MRAARSPNPERFLIPVLALVTLAPACYEDGTETAESDNNNDAGPLTRPDLDASGNADSNDAGGGRPDIGGPGDADSDDAGSNDVDNGVDSTPPDSGAGPVVDFETAARAFATVACEGLRQCSPDAFAFYYSALGECVYQRATGLMDYIGYADDDCVAAMSEYVDCVDTNGECLIDDYYGYYGYETEYFGVDAGACDTAKFAFGAACDVDVSG